MNPPHPQQVILSTMYDHVETVTTLYRSYLFKVRESNGLIRKRDHLQASEKLIQANSMRTAIVLELGNLSDYVNSLEDSDPDFKFVKETGVKLTNPVKDIIKSISITE